MTRAAIIQSNYIPWKGYFDIVHDVDVFVFLDDVQYTTRDWRNRNRIKTAAGTAWLTVPTTSRRHLLINEVSLPDGHWQARHWKTLQHCYSKAPYFHLYREFLENVYLGTKWDKLSVLNRYLITSISRQFLKVETEFRDSSSYQAEGKKQDRLLDLIGKIGATAYVSGPSARNYIDQEGFSNAGVKLEYKSYEGYPEYSQFHPPFVHGVTILDLLFHTGPDAPFYIWGWRERQRGGGA